MTPRDYFDMLGRAIYRDDEAKIGVLLDEQFILYEDQGLPYGGAYRGIEGFSKVRHIVFTLWQDREMTELGFYAGHADQSFAVLLRMAGRLDDSCEITETIVNEVWNVVDGRARSARVWYWNTPLITERCAARFRQLMRDAQ